MYITQAYRDYIKSPKWKAKREEVFRRYGKRCTACGSRKNISVHHLSYARLGREPLSDLMPLCKVCHDEVTRLYRRNRRQDLRRVSWTFVKARRNQITNRLPRTASN